MKDVPDLSTQMHRLWEALDAKMLRRALRGALAAEARKVRTAAVGELRRTTTKKGRRLNARGMAKAVQAKVGRRLQGFVVLVKARGDEYMTINRHGNLKPLAYWWAHGTKRKGIVYQHPHPFLDHAETTTMPQSLDRISTKAQLKIVQTAKKFGKL